MTTKWNCIAIRAAVALWSCSFATCAAVPDSIACNFRNVDVAFEGTVRYVRIEGGFYGLVADDGTKYYPGDLPRAFQRGGLRVSATLRVKCNVVYLHMWGTSVEVIEIQRRSP